MVAIITEVAKIVEQAELDPAWVEHINCPSSLLEYTSSCQINNLTYSFHDVADSKLIESV